MEEAELSEVYERINDGFLALNDELQFTHLNDHAEDLLKLSNLKGRASNYY